MECINLKRHSREYLKKEEFGYKLQKAIGRVHYLSTSLPDYPHGIDEDVVSGIVSILDDVHDELVGVYEGHFQEVEATPQ